MTVSGIAPPNGAELELLRLVRDARQKRDYANQAAEAITDARSTYELLNREAQEAEKAADAAWRRLANPEYAESE